MHGIVRHADADRFDPHSLAVPLHNFSADRQADTDSFIRVGRMQALKYLEDTLEILGIVPVPLYRTDNVQ